MSFIYSQALVAASSPDSCLDTDASVPSSGIPTPKPCLWHDKTMDASRHSRFGMTCKPLTESLGAELLTLWLAGFPVKTSQSQGGAQESPESAAECGSIWRESLARFDPVTSSWKTAQHSLLEELELSLVIWPRSGMTVAGRCWELPMSVLRTSATGSGLWPTPQSRDYRSGDAIDSPRAQRKMAAGWSPNLNDVVKWPTLTVCGNYNRKGASATSGDGLATAVRMWPTPTCNMVSGGANHNSPQVLAGRHGINLAGAVANWPTPQASDNRNRGNMSNPSIQRRVARGKQIMLSQSLHPISGQLNPTWVEWLMGWPIGHTDLKPLATDKSHSAPPQRGVC
jgi:hypothetical protein